MRDGFALVNVAFALRVIQPAVIIRMPIKTGGGGGGGGRGCNLLRSRSRVISDPPPVMSRSTLLPARELRAREFPAAIPFFPAAPDISAFRLSGRGR